MQTHKDSIKKLKEILDSERRNSEVRWKRQLHEIEKLASNNNEFYAELKIIVPNLPEINTLDNELLESGLKDKNEDEATLF